MVGPVRSLGPGEHEKKKKPNRGRGTLGARQIRIAWGSIAGLCLALSHLKSQDLDPEHLTSAGKMKGREEGQRARERQAGHSQWGVPDAESLQVAAIKARLPGDIGTLGHGYHRHIGDHMGAGSWAGEGDGRREAGQAPLPSLSHMISPTPPVLVPNQALTQHVDICEGSHSGYCIAGTAFPAPVGLLGQWPQDEATIAVHLGLDPQPPGHLQNHWSALRTQQPPLTKGATHLSGQLRLPPHPPCSSRLPESSSFLHWPAVWGGGRKGSRCTRKPYLGPRYCRRRVSSGRAGDQ